MKRHCTDIVQFDLNPSLESTLDIMDLPLYGSVNNEILTLTTSRFKDVSFYIPTLCKQAVYHGQDLEVLESNESNSESDHNEEEKEEDMHAVHVEETNPVQETTLCRLSRPS